MKTLLKAIFLVSIIFTFSNCTTDSLNDFQGEPAAEIETNTFSLEFINESSETMRVRILNQENTDSQRTDEEQTGSSEGDGVVNIRPGGSHKGTKTSAISLGENTFFITITSLFGRTTTTDSVTITVVINIEEGYEYYIILNEDHTVSVIAEEI